jgi:very-short-patch-repair endonuclease
VLVVHAGYAVDISIPSMRVAVEADGPSHFSRTAHPSLGLLQLGATAMKRRHLQQLGWVVVNVPYSEWDRQTDEQQRVAYLQQRIAEAKRDLVAVTGAAAVKGSTSTSSAVGA